MSSTVAELDAPLAEPTTDRVVCRVVRTDDDLAELQSAWERLGNAVKSPIETFGWTAAANATGKQRPALIVAEHSGSLRAIAPLGSCGRLLGQRFEIAGMSWLFEPADFISADLEALDEVIRRAVRLRRPVMLGRLPADSPTVTAFQRLARGRGKVLIRPHASCPYIALDSTWLQPESHLSSRRRSDYRRALRRAEQLGPVKAEIITPRPDEVASLLDTAFAIEARSWKGTEGTALARDSIRGQCMRHFADWASRTGILRIALLQIGDEYAAMQIAAECNRAFWLLKIGFDPEFANCSPGNLLLAESLRYSSGRGLSSLEFLGVVEPWTQVWTDLERPCVSLRYYPFNLHGGAAFAAEATAAAVRRIGSRFNRPAAHDTTEQAS